MRGYDYDRYYRQERYEPLPSAAGWGPGGVLPNAPMYGWGWWGGSLGWPPYPAAFAPDYRPLMRRPPRESPAYGRGADRFARDWAQRYGYDLEMTLGPAEAERDPRGARRRSFRYDRPVRNRREPYDRTGGYRQRW